MRGTVIGLKSDAPLTVPKAIEALVIRINRSAASLSADIELQNVPGYRRLLMLGCEITLDLKTRKPEDIAYSDEVLSIDTRGNCLFRRGKLSDSIRKRILDAISEELKVN